MLIQMARSVGIDLVAVAEIRDTVRKHGPAYLRRIYAPAELDDCCVGAKLDTRRLAATFAAKEATIKALRPGRSEALPWFEITVVRERDSTPGVSLAGSAFQFAARAGIIVTSLSLSYDDRLAMAVVVTEIEA
jgi:holo-[acyl-carrier protein] synthase